MLNKKIVAMLLILLANLARAEFVNDHFVVRGKVIGFDKINVKVSSRGRVYDVSRKSIASVYPIKIGERVVAEVKPEHSKGWQRLNKLPPVKESFKPKVLRSYAKVFKRLSRKNK